MASHLAGAGPYSATGNCIKSMSMARPLSLSVSAALALASPMPGAAAQPAPPVAPPVAAPGPPAVAAAPGPALGRVRIFEDWSVGCDNRLSCTAISLVPEGGGDAYSVLVSIERDAGAYGTTRLQLSGANELKGMIDLVIDGKQVASLMATRDSATATGEQAFTLSRTLGSSYTFEIRQKTDVLGAPSLSGLALALRYIDEVQGRIGSRRALAAIGDGPPDLARPAPPEATFALMPNGPPASGPLSLSDAGHLAVQRLAVCDGRPRSNYPVELRGLDREHLLVLLPCDAGADNVSSVALIGTGEAGQRSFQIARFDLVPGFSGDPGTPPLIVNAQWNPERGELSSFVRGRPLGDCGTTETYRWDGAMFRLTEARAMPVCRGAWLWPVLWRARPVDAVAGKDGGAQ